MTKVSVMVTSYNLHDYIDTSIRSVVSQQYPCEWELLVGDDGSTDGTLDILEKWKARYPNRIQLFVTERGDDNEKNGFRAAHNRARLLEKANGDYLIFLDGDDCWTFSNKISEQLYHISQKENDDCSCCAHNIEAYKTTTGESYPMTSTNIRCRKYDAGEYWADMYFHTNTILFRKQCKELLLTYKDYLNDNFITYILLQFGKILYLDKIWARYNLTGSGLWTGKSQIYGRFRNMKLLDLEISLNPDLKYHCIKRHIGDFNLILREYKPSFDYNSIQPIVSNLDASLFRYTTSLSTDSNCKWFLRRLEYKLLLLFYKAIIKIKTRTSSNL